VASRVVRMTKVVNPHKVPAARAMASPNSCEGLPLLSPSLNATATDAKATHNPAHCTARSFSLGTKRGNSRATTKGDV